MSRQPLRPLPNAINIGPKSITISTKEKPPKSFSVFAEKDSNRPSDPRGLKRGSDSHQPLSGRPAKLIRPSGAQYTSKAREPAISQASLEELVNRMVDEKLAKQALNDNDKASVPVLSEEIQRRLDALEQRVEKKEDGGRAEGLQYLLMAKQHTVRGEEASALRMYQLAVPFFPDNEKLANKMLALQDKMRQKREPKPLDSTQPLQPRPALTALPLTSNGHRKPSHELDDDYTDELQQRDDDYDSDASFHFKSKSKPKRQPVKAKVKSFNDSSSTDPLAEPASGELTPRSSRLLRIINTRDLSQIRLLRGVGLKKGEAIVNCLCEMDEEDESVLITSLDQLGGLRGVGSKTVENMRSGIAV